MQYTTCPLTLLVVGRLRTPSTLSRLRRRGNPGLPLELGAWWFWSLFFVLGRPFVPTSAGCFERCFWYIFFFRLFPWRTPGPVDPPLGPLGAQVGEMVPSLLRPRGPAFKSSFLLRPILLRLLGALSDMGRWTRGSGSLRIYVASFKFQLLFSHDLHSGRRRLFR